MRTNSSRYFITFPDIDCKRCKGLRISSTSRTNDQFFSGIYRAEDIFESFLPFAASGMNDSFGSAIFKPTNHVPSANPNNGD